MQLPRVATCIAVLGLHVRHLVVQALPAEVLEIQFEPMGIGEEPPKELLDLFGAVDGPNSPLASRHPKEAQLDKELFEALSKGRQHHLPPFLHHRHHPPNPFGHHPPNPFGHHPPSFGGGPFDSGPTVVMEIEGPSPMSSGFPATVFRDLFPGPLGLGTSPHHPVPFDEPDPLVQNLMKDLDSTFVGLMGSFEKAAGADRMPNSCSDDIKKTCQDAKSKLHCLGLHASEVSDACHKDIGKSVPFRCSRPIDKFCDVMEVGILQCLGDHMADLNEQCKDAVLATHHVISKANTQKTVVVDTSTGAKKVSEPSANATPPPSLLGGLPAHLSPSMLPHSVRELLGVAQSISVLGAAQSIQSIAEKLEKEAAVNGWQTVKEWARLVMVLFVLVFLLCRMPPTSWPERKLRGMFGLKCKEDECLIGPCKGTVELRRPVDPAFAK